MVLLTIGRYITFFKEQRSSDRKITFTTFKIHLSMEISITIDFLFIIGAYILTFYNSREIFAKHITLILFF